MRVIAGSCRSLPLEAVPGMGTRPTTDRIKETQFNVIQLRVPGSNFLDLFAGSGAIGIEALSRGARHAWFVDSDRKAVEVIRRNLAFTKLAGQADVLHAQAADAVRRLADVPVMDIVFLDPPYDRGLERETLAVLKDAACTGPDTLYILEASKENELSWLEESGFYPVREKIYKTNKHVFLQETR